MASFTDAEDLRRYVGGILEQVLTLVPSTRSLFPAHRELLVRDGRTDLLGH